MQDLSDHSFSNVEPVNPLGSVFPVNVLRAYYGAYLSNGSRSTAKLIPVHSEIARTLEASLRSECLVMAQGHVNDKEFVSEGLLYPKKTDITAVKVSDSGEHAVGSISVKLPASNYKQNANNYFESMLGETANLKLNNIVVAHFIILPAVLPYFNRDGSIAKLERITDADISKYMKLMNTGSVVAPDALFLALADYGVEHKFEVGANLDNIRDAFASGDTLPPRILDAQGLAALTRPTTNGGTEPQLSAESIDFLVKHSHYGNFMDTFVKKLNVQ